MTKALLFPGQGAGSEPTFCSWYDSSPAVRQLVECAAHHTGVPVDKLLARGARALRRTDLLQPVLTAVVLGIFEELSARRVRFDIVAGHSLGEIAACSAAGCVSAEAAVMLAVERGRLMARQAARHPGGMAALGVRSTEEAQAALAVARAHGIASIAAQNAPDQWVISGEEAALRALHRRFATSPLEVAGPWHSGAMADAVEEFRAAARSVVTNAPKIPLVCNRSGAVVERADEIPDLLAEQFTHPIQWTVAMDTMATFCVDEFVIPGPGKVLRGLVRQNLGAAAVVCSVDLPVDLETLPEALVR